MLPLSIPSPVAGRLAPRPAPDPRLRAVHHRRRRRRGLDRRAALGRPRRASPARSATSPIWAVPFGIVGGRLYHVITDNGNVLRRRAATRSRALYVWQGGLGIWGAIALGGVGAYIGARRAGIKFPPLADALAPGHRRSPRRSAGWGNWFNQELFGKPTDAALGARDPRRGAAAPRATQQYDDLPPDVPLRVLWDLGVAGLVIWADRRFRLGHGRAFALYVAAFNEAWGSNWGLSRSPTPRSSSRPRT